MSSDLRNIAYVDGQNLHMGTTSTKPSWSVDLARFRNYLNHKYDVDTAYYYLGFVQEGANFEKLYETIQKAGFILVFREHNSAMLGTKKGNVDTDIVFSIMKRLYLKEKFNKVVLVSGDGDYKMLVDFLIAEKRFKKILFPNGKRRSSLYKSIDIKYYDHLDSADIKRKISNKKEKLP